MGSLDGRAEEVRQLQQTMGWGIVERFLADKIKYHKDQLMVCPTDEVFVHRAKVKAHESLGLHLQEILQNSIEENEE